jgi:CspA family cold shock protein
MPVGTVKLFNLSKGYGFVRPDDGGDDVFVHLVHLGKSGITSLDRGHRVEFDLEPDPHSGQPRATNLKVLDRGDAVT